MRRAVLALLLATCAAMSARAADGPLERLAWLAGCWATEGADTGSGEQWLPLAGGSLLGVARTVRQGATVAHAFMQVRALADGGVAYLLQAADRPEMAFLLQPAATPAEATFESAQREFPQRVLYRLEGGERLRVRHEGPRGGVLQGIESTLVRSACEVPPAQPEAFQGLRWGAGELALAQRFGTALRPADCAPPARRRPREACNHPTLAPYEVAGVPFRLNLHLDERTRQLVRVSLVWDGVVAGGADNGFSEKHRLLRQLLTQRYGSPESTHVATESEVWNATARWRHGETLIELASTFQPRGAAAPAREQVEIVYQPVTAGDAGKL